MALKKTVLMTPLLAGIIFMSVTAMSSVHEAKAQASFENQLCNLVGGLGCASTCYGLSALCGPGAPICAGTFSTACGAVCGMGINEACSYVDRPPIFQNDAGTPDAGTPDAGTPDAGTPDAGTPDAGTPGTGDSEEIIFDDSEGEVITPGDDGTSDTGGVSDSGGGDFGDTGGVSDSGGGDFGDTGGVSDSGGGDFGGGDFGGGDFGGGDFGGGDFGGGGDDCIDDGICLLEN